MTSVSRTPRWQTHPEAPRARRRPVGAGGAGRGELGQDLVARVHELDADARAAEVGDGGCHLDTGHAATGHE